MRTCEVTGCSNFVFGTDRKLNIGYCKNHQTLRTDISHESIMQRALAKQRKNASVKVGRELRGLAYVNPEIKAPKDYRSKSQLLVEADRTFGDWIKRRDTKNGMIFCPCCRGRFEIDKMSNGQKVVQLLHFVDRDVYSLRFDEDNAHAGCCWCNKKQYDNPRGMEYNNYREYLVNKIGEIPVAEMELQHRQINKITEQQLKVVIEHYSNN